MPSGAKKRKAERRKKEQQQQQQKTEKDNDKSSSINGNHHYPEPNETKSLDDRDSDTGDVHSPGSLGHLNDQCHEGNEDSEMVEVEESQKVPVQNGVVEIEKELNSVEDSENEVMNGKHEPFPEGVLLIAEHESGGNKVHPNDQFIEGNKESEPPIEFDENQNIDVGDEDCKVIAIDKELNSMEESENKFMNGGELEHFSEEVVLVAENEKQYKVSRDSSIEKTSDVLGFGNAVLPESEAENLVMESSRSEKLEKTEGKVLPMLKPFEFHRGSQVASAKDKNYDKVFPLSTDNIGASLDIVVTNVNENGVNTSSLPVSVAVENGCHPESNEESMLFVASNGEKESQVSLTSGTRAVEAGHNAQNGKIHSKNLQLLKNEPLIDPMPRVRQRTSWMSCCGLFEVFAQSNK